MSQDFFDPELFASFIVEAKEHLETIEPNLLELEKTPDNISLLNEIFRPMHSLKGASSFLGLHKINGLAHKAENILDELRKGAIGVNPEIMDIILSSTDALRQMINNLESESSEGGVDTGPLIATLDALMEGPSTATATTGKSIADSVPGISTPTAAETFSAGEKEASATIRQGNDASEWLVTLEKQPPYALTAFGEDHLRDFVEESRDNISQLADSLLELEKQPGEQSAVINTLFRCFHNLKGNSGLIAFQEVNSLTHEAETLLNSMRRNERSVSASLVDLLLLVVDTLEALIHSIDPATGIVTPFDIVELLESLRQAVAGEAIALPESLLPTSGSRLLEPNDSADPVQTEQTEQTGKTDKGNNSGGLNADVEDIAVFKTTADQQFEHMAEAIKGMRKDGNDREYADAMFRSLSTLQNSSGFMGLGEIKLYTQRTAAIVDKGRSTGLDFSIMADLLEQESAIIRDMIREVIGSSLDVYVPVDEEDGEDNAEGRNDTPIPEETQTTAPDAPAETDNVVSTAPVAQQEAAAAPVPAQQMAKADRVKTEPAKPEPIRAEHARSNGKGVEGKTDTGTTSSSTIRVDHEKLDHLMNLIGELIINRNRYSMLARQLEGATSADISAIAQNLNDTTYSMIRISDDLQDTIMKVRMVPIASVFSRFPRLVRDLSRKSGKEVELIMAGEDTELDKSVVEVIGDPLVHLIRNSVDHGIEPEATRLELGKPAKGTISLRAFYKGNSVVIEIEDDGKGIDPEKMREVAVRKGIINQEDARALTDQEAMELIFAPGFSSAEVVTDISGRGVGMDVVRTNIKNLKGSISINSEVGKGATFTLSLPLTLAIIDALMVNLSGQTYAIPLDAVTETNKVESRRLTDISGRKALTLRDEVLGIVELAELLGLPVTPPLNEREMLSLVIVHDNGRRLGLVVDRLLERQEIVIKPLGSYLGDIRGISGATIMGDGNVILILDPHEIYMLATSKTA